MKAQDSQLIWMITGCASGFGRRFVPAILRKGDKVIATSRKLESVQNLPNEVSKMGLDADSLRIMELDLEWGTEKLDSAVKEALDIFGRIDVLINNGGVGIKSLIEESSADLFMRQFQINVFGHVDVTNAVLPSMRARKSGTIVVMGSRSSWRPEMPVIGPYASSKAAVTAWGETLATELIPFNVRVMIIQPANFRTEGMLMYPYHDDKRIPEYDLMREQTLEVTASLQGKQPGDPVKAVEIIVDVVRGEGKAKGRKFPRYLPLGSDAALGIREKTDIMLGVLEEWKDVIGSMNYEA